MLWRGSKRNHRKDACLKVIGLHFQVIITTLHSTMNTTKKTYIPNWEIDKHALLITVTKSRKRSNYQHGFYICFHHRSTDAPQILLCESNRQKLENMRNEPNNTYRIGRRFPNLRGPTYASDHSLTKKTNCVRPYTCYWGLPTLNPFLGAPPHLPIPCVKMIRRVSRAIPSPFIPLPLPFPPFL